MDAAYYTEYAVIERTHWWFRARRDILTRLLGQHRYLHVCDLGCGTGENLHFLAQWSHDVLGVDQNPELEASDIVCADVAQTGLPSGDENLVTAFDVLEHCVDDQAVCREAYRLLVPGCCFVVTVPAHPWLWGRQDSISHHQRRYTKRWLLHILRETGFEIERVTAFNTWFFPVVAAIRLYRRWTKDESTESDFTMTKPGMWNEVAYQIMRTEAWVLRWMNLPVGVSYAVVARKPT